jgi:hypothetical protein
MAKREQAKKDKKWNFDNYLHWFICIVFSPFGKLFRRDKQKDVNIPNLKFVNVPLS